MWAKNGIFTYLGPAADHLPWWLMQYLCPCPGSTQTRRNPDNLASCRARITGRWKVLSQHFIKKESILDPPF